MDKSNSKQKKNIMGYVYVVLIGLLVIAGAITIAVVALKSRMVNSAETYKLSINGTLCAVGDTVTIAAS